MVLLFGELQDNVAAVSSNWFVLFGFAKDGMHVWMGSTQLVDMLHLLGLLLIGQHFFFNFFTNCLHVVLQRRGRSRLLFLHFCFLRFENCVKLRAIRNNNDGVLRRMAIRMHFCIFLSSKRLCKRHVGQAWFHDEVFVVVRHS